MFGDERPKQFAKIVGSKSLLRCTLDRVALQIAPERTVIVTCQAHSQYIEQEFPDGTEQKILTQPADRGTAAGILLPAHWIHSRDPEAVVAVFPSDHFILEDGHFMEQILRVTDFVRRASERLVLIGAQATEAETEYGWIEPGELIGRVDGTPVRSVRGFWEKPVPDIARACLASGCFWNTLVFVSRASTLVKLGWESLPAVAARLTRITQLLGTHSLRYVEHEWGLLLKADFSHKVLEASPSTLAVSPLPALTWSDLGTPRRVMQTLQLMDTGKVSVA
jgi:mannose-1-phosphate guanylyltransferase